MNTAFRIFWAGLIVVLWPHLALAQRQGADGNLSISSTERVALVIGNASYKDAPLANPVNDATDMAAALRSFGFRVIVRTNASQREMRSAIREFGVELRRAQVGLFYFAGHGIQLKGNNYLVPVGTYIESEADAEDLAIDTQFSVQYLSDNTKIGYWLWACPLVQYMEKNYKTRVDSLFVKTIRIIAQARANEIAYQVGAKSQNDIVGKFVRIIGEGICFIIGSIAKPFLAKKFNNWLTMYSTKQG